MTGQRVDAPGASSASYRAAAALASAQLESLPSMTGESRQLEILPGGLTNRNYRVTTASGHRMVARFSAAKSGLLAIDRSAEFANSRAAAAAGVGPEVLDYAPDQGILVVEWIDGKTFTPSDLTDERVLTRIVQTCRQLHAGPRFVNEFDMFDIQRRYLAIVRELDFRMPPDYLDYQSQVARIERAMRAGAAPSVPCHNDLLAANIMDDGERVWFIDFEYAGNNDPCFELGNIWSEASLSPEHLEHLVTTYYGGRSVARTARARLLGLMSKYGWTLWACIQDAVSDVDFDFWEWGMEKYARAVAEFRSADFDRLISTVSEQDRHEGV